MLSLIGFIPSILTFLTGLSGTVGKVSDNIKELEIKKQDVKSNKELKEIDAEILAMHDRKDVLVANAGNRLYWIAVSALATGPILYIFKYYAIDKVWGSLMGCAGEVGQTLAHCHKYTMDGLNVEMAAVTTAVLSFFLLAGVFKK